jgi:16S rRNA processing protein RimM
MSQKTVDARLVGIVGKPHGIKGELNVMLLTDYPDSIINGCVLYLDQDCTRDILIENVYIKKSRGRETAVIRFQGISSIDEALDLRGSQLFRKKDQSPVLEDGEYWIEDLEGCRVYTESGRQVGVVEKVEVLPANDNLAVRPAGGGSIIYIPLVDDYICSIEITGKKIILKKMPEYL